MSLPTRIRLCFPLSQLLPSGSFHNFLSFSIRGQTDWKPQSQKLIHLITWSTDWSKSVKQWAMPCRTTQDRQVIVENSDKTCSTAEGNGKPFWYSCLENPMNSRKRQKYRTLRYELPRSVGAWYMTGYQWRNNSIKNEETKSKQKQHSVMDVW